MEQFRWYLEHFLDYLFDPEIGHAGHVLDALQAWGTQAFNALFDRRDAAIGGKCRVPSRRSKLRLLARLNLEGREPELPGLVRILWRDFDFRLPTRLCNRRLTLP
jgi:hypothetical protein